MRHLLKCLLFIAAVSLVSSDHAHAESPGTGGYWGLIEPAGAFTGGLLTSPLMGDPDLELYGDVGIRSYTVDDYTLCSLESVTTTINGSDCVCTEGTDWTAATDNDTTATSLAVCVNACVGISATAAAAVVTITHPLLTTYSITLAESDAACTSFTEGADGVVQINRLTMLGGDLNLDTNASQLVVDDGTAGNPSIIAGSSDDGTGTGIYFGTDIISFATNGNGRWNITAGGVLISNSSGSHLNMNSRRVFDSLGALNLGDTYSVTQGGVTGSVGIGKDAGGVSLEVEGSSFFEGTARFGGTATHAASLLMEDDKRFILGTGGTTTDSFIIPATSQDANTWLFGSDQGNHVAIGLSTHGVTRDYDHAETTDPTVFIHSRTDPDTDNTQWSSRTHNTADAEYGVGKGNHKFLAAEAKGQATSVSFRVESVTFAADPGDASKTTVGTIIARGDDLSHVSARVVTAGANCSSFSVGDGSDPDLWGASIAVADATTFDGDGLTAIWNRPALADQEITVTANGGNCFGLVVALTAHLATGTAATSD